MVEFIHYGGLMRVIFSQNSILCVNFRNNQLINLHFHISLSFCLIKHKKWGEKGKAVQL